MEKIFIGIFIGIVAVKAYQDNMEKSKKIDQDVALVDTGVTGYKDGFLDGKGFFRSHHAHNHPDCELCPAH